MYLYNALKREKDNDGKRSVGINSIRHVKYNGMSENDVISKLIGSIISTKNVGIWRIYRTVDKRNFLEAKIELVNKIMRDISNESSFDNNIESDFKTILANPKCRSGRSYLIDVDTNDSVYVNLIIHVIRNSFNDGKSPWIPSVKCEKTKTPNGYHLVSDLFDTRVLKDMEHVEIKKDALLFVMILELTNDLRIKVLEPTANKYYIHNI